MMVKWVISTCEHVSEVTCHISIEAEVTTWATLANDRGLGVINITGTITFNRSIMAYILYTSSHGNPKPSNRPGCPSITTTKQGFSVTFEVDFKSGRTVKIAKDEVHERPGLHDGAEFIVIALGGNDLCPGKIPSDDLKLAKEVAKDLWDLQQTLSRNATRVDVCTLIPRPKYDQFHQLLIEQTNICIKQKFGENGLKHHVLDLADFYTNKRIQDMFIDGIHLTDQGYKIFKKAITNRGLAHLKHTY